MTIAEGNAPVAENIDRIIQSKGLYKCHVADRVNLTRQQLTDMLNGRKIIRPCDILAISGALGVDVNALFFP